MESEPPKADLPKLKRRWYQFGLRTLMIVVAMVAAACAYIAHEARVVRDRQEFFSAHDTKNHVQTPQSTTKILANGNRMSLGDEPSFIRRWLGDIRYMEILLYAPVTEEEQRKAVELFPEALVIVRDNHWEIRPDYRYKEDNHGRLNHEEVLKRYRANLASLEDNRKNMTPEEYASRRKQIDRYWQQALGSVHE
jgi:hypothetical protein